MAHLRSLTRKDVPARAQSLLEWQQFAQLLVTFTVAFGNIVNALGDLAGIGKE